MPDATKAEQTVVLDDGRKLQFVYDVNSWIDISDELGMEVPDIIAKLTDKANPPSLKVQRVIIWGGLRKHHSEMSIRDAGEVMVEAAVAMEKALGGSLPQAEEGTSADDEADPPRRRGRGTASSKAGVA
jgi:hypothetical protein